MPTLPRKCSNCKWWRQGRRRWDERTHASVWDGHNSDLGVCYGVEPSTQTETSFPRTHRDDQCPRFNQRSEDV